MTCDGDIIVDTLIINIRVQNLTGHKFPTGFPSRRAWLYVIVTDSNGEIVFESGKWDDTGKIIGLDPNFEPHHQEIKQPGQIQIYQAVMADVNDQVTFTLLRGASYKKDNRLPPKGFTTRAASYDDMAIMGDAAQDPDFNRDDAGEGTGSDQVRYKVAIAGRGNDFFVQATMVYQTLAWPFAQHLLSLATESITRFRNFYESADRTPIPIQSVSLSVKSTSVRQEELNTPEKYNLLHCFPNPFNQSTVIALSLAEAGPIRLDIYNLLGRRVRILAQGRFQAGNYRFCWDGTDAQGESLSSGVFFVALNTNRQNLSNRLLLIK